MPLGAVVSGILEFIVEGRWLFGERSERSTGKIMGESCQAFETNHKHKRGGWWPMEGVEVKAGRKAGAGFLSTWCSVL